MSAEPDANKANGEAQAARNRRALYEIYISAHRRPVSNLYAGRLYLAVRSCGDRYVLDLILVALGVAFFAVSILYTIACNRL